MVVPTKLERNIYFKLEPQDILCDVQTDSLVHLSVFLLSPSSPLGGQTFGEIIGVASCNKSPPADVSRRAREARQARLNTPRPVLLGGVISGVIGPVWNSIP